MIMKSYIRRLSVAQTYTFRHFSSVVDKAEALTKLLPRLLVTKPLRSSPVVPCSLAYTLA